MHPAEAVVETVEAGAGAQDGAAVLCVGPDLGERVFRGGSQGLNGLRLAPRARRLVNPRLGAVEEDLEVADVRVAFGRDGLACRNQRPEAPLVEHDPRVGVDLGGAERGRGAEDLVEVRHPAHLSQPVAILEPARDGDHVGRRRCLAQGHGRLEDAPMGLGVKVLRDEHLDGPPKRRGAQKARAEDSRFGVEVVGWYAAGGAGDDADESAHQVTSKRAAATSARATGSDRMGGSGGRPAPRLFRFRDSGRDRSRVGPDVVAAGADASVRSPPLSQATKRWAL